MKYTHILLTTMLSAALAGPLYADQADVDAARHDHGRMAHTAALHITHGVAAGDVTAHSAVIWARASGPGTMHVQIDGRHDDGRKDHSVAVDTQDDFTGKVLVDGLKPDRAYAYRVWFSARDGHGHGKRNSVTGTFRTAPKSSQAQAVTLAWGGDVAGQNVCRDAREGFPIFNAINSMAPDFFIGLGDMIYADGVCQATGLYGNAQVPGDFLQAANMDDFWAHWKYNRDDDAYRTLLASMPYYAIWDDHEVVNDFGPLHDTRSTAPYTEGVHLLPMGLKAFLDYNPIAVADNTPKRLYRNVRWGKHLELFILDTRQYRDANLASDSAERPKTMLGREQLTWLKDTLATSDATWKVIVSSVPMSIPTGFPPELGRDGWANYDQDTGFEQELTDILRSLQANGERNVVFITTDVHFAEAFRYTPFADDPGFVVYEIVTGPLNAGLFPNRNYDTTLGTESLFFFGPASSSDVTSYTIARQWMNFGTLAIDAHGRLQAAIRDINGAAVYDLTLDPQ